MDADSLDGQMAELAALRRENAMLRETLDAIDGGVVVYGPDQSYRFGNRLYHEVFPHLPPESELTQVHYADVLALSMAAGTVTDPQARTDPAAFIARRVIEIEDRDTTSRDIHDKAQDRWFQIRVRWTPGGNRVSLRLDITELKRLQHELLRTQRMEAIGRISGGVAHDFNNILTVITSNLEMIQLRPGDARRVAALAAGGLTAAEAGARLIRQLLTFARRDITQQRVLSPNALLTGLADLLRRTAGPGIAFALELGDNVGQARVDATQFESAMMNLVLNACEAIQAIGESGWITVATRGEQDVIVVSVEDSGCGMSAEVAAQAFEPFFTTKPVGAGPGLGLSQVYGFATGANGQAVIDSIPGQGTTMTIRLPRV